MKEGEVDFQLIFDKLKEVFLPLKGKLIVKGSRITEYYLTFPGKLPEEILFGCIEQNSQHVFINLTPLQCIPSILTGVSKKLKGRMRSKSGFYFKSLEEDLFIELKDLTLISYRLFKKTDVKTLKKSMY